MQHRVGKCIKLTFNFRSFQKYCCNFRMYRRIGVPIILFAFADVLQVSNAFLALLCEFVYSTVDVLAPGQGRSVRTTTRQITHDSRPESAQITHEVHEQVMVKRCFILKMGHIRQFFFIYTQVGT